MIRSRDEDVGANYPNVGYLLAPRLLSGTRRLSTGTTHKRATSSIRRARPTGSRGPGGLPIHPGMVTATLAPRPIWARHRRRKRLLGITPSPESKSGHSCTGDNDEARPSSLAEPAERFEEVTDRCTLMPLKKSLTVLLTRFSGVVLPLTHVRERFVGRSERSIFSPAGWKRRAATFSTASSQSGRFDLVWFTVR
ncbi:hypothetical protein LMG28138_03817 [Pararobbsia alpina]|uniref:Uncharacterized protein n=1 Tax=Pararobbsia alpina TaxID=621374 RepID=A0A6S7BC81_9BURK|nr:hypothetical protein LMG28138_03817 [Pararobbsia alpina]